MTDKSSGVSDVIAESRKVLRRAVLVSITMSFAVAVVVIGGAVVALYSSVSDVVQTGVDNKLAETAALISQLRKSPLSRIPIGSVLAYPADSSALPDGFLVCDGRELSKQAYPELFDILGVRYGGRGDSFRLPDYGGLFLRGVHGTREIGTLQEDSIGEHRHHVVLQGGAHAHGTFEVARVSTGGGDTRGPNGAARHTVMVAGGAHTHTGDTSEFGGDETRPKNISVNWIIRARLQRDLTSKGLTSLPTDRR